jgi:two-component system heavy metal sensor histidine kinase CusS
MGAALIVIALLAFLGIRRTLLTQLDRSLRATAELQAYSYTYSGSIVRLPNYPPDSDHFIQDVNRFVAVRDSLGRILDANTAGARRLPVDGKALARAQSGATAIVTDRIDEHDFRILYRPIPGSAGGSTAVLQVSASLQPLLHAARNDLWLMLATAGIGALAALAGSWWLGGSALAPVHAIASQARRVQGDATGQSITAHADVAELQGLIAVLNEMIARLERSREWHRRIIRDLGHDLRTPIAAMQAGVDVSLRGTRSPEAYRLALVNVQEELDRLTLISDALVLLGRLEHGELAPVPARTDLAVLVREAVDRAQSRTEAGSRIRAVADGAVWGEVDRRLLGMALDQLIDNAIRHAPASTRIEVTVSGTDGRIALAVEDDGPGVPNEHLPHLVERFFRGDEARGRGAGPGLGLTAVAAIVDLHRGTIVADRGPMSGLRVRIDLPAS